RTPPPRRPAPGPARRAGPARLGQGPARQRPPRPGHPVPRGRRPGLVGRAGQGRPRGLVAVVSDAGRAKRLVPGASDAAAGGCAPRADRLVYSYLARPLARALCAAEGQVLDVAAGSGALGRLLPAVRALPLPRAPPGPT